MKLQDCEVIQLLMRGVPAVVLIGNEAVNGAESAALLAEYDKAYGDNARPVVYFSKDGWQTPREAKPAETKKADKIVAAHVEEAKAEEAAKAGEAPPPAPEPAMPPASAPPADEAAKPGAPEMLTPAKGKGHK